MHDDLDRRKRTHIRIGYLPNRSVEPHYIILGKKFDVPNLKYTLSSRRNRRENLSRMKGRNMCFLLVYI